MQTPHIEADWRGVYRYDPIEELEQTLPEVGFEMKITPRWLGRFTGSIVEDEGGAPDPARIAGRVSAGTITFKKTYPSLAVLRPDGVSVALSGQPSQVLRYRGELSADGTQIVGTWRNVPRVIRIAGQCLQIPKTTGTWEASAR